MLKTNVDDRSVALCIDLDGTLVRTDLLIESALRVAKDQPLEGVGAVLGLVSGRARMKQRLADLVDLRIDLLPYEPAVVELATAAKAAGRCVVLATASNRKYAEQVAAHLGLFDAVQASDDTVNLSSATKAERLVEAYGERGFDYVGDAAKDLAVWRRARRAVVVNAGSRVRSAVARLGIPCEVLNPRGSAAAQLLRAVRPHQWLKNTLVFLPLLASHRYSDLDAILHVLMAFAVFGLLASAGYVINDLLDLDADRQHPRKRARPFASGALPLTWGLVLVALLFTGGVILSIFLPPLFLAVAGVYFITTLTYSLHLKRHITFDVITLAGLYTLRVIAGAAAIDLPLSFWLLAFSMFLFLGLAYLKRYAELESLRREGGDWASGRGYGVGDLELVRGLGIPAGYSAVLVLALYINSPEVRTLYQHPTLIWLICPLLLYWTARSWSIAHRGQMHDDPLVFAIEDRGSQAVILASALILWFAV